MQYIVLVVVCLLITGCGGEASSPAESVGSGPQSEQVVNVYTHRHYPADQKLFAAFTAETGIKVNVIQAKADELLKRLEIEGKDSQADVLITVDAGRLVRAKEKGLLQSVESEALDSKLAPDLQDADKQWFALTMRARVLVYAKDRVPVNTLPATYGALTDDAWQGKILVRSSQNIYNQSLLAAMVHHHGAEQAAAWAKGVVANMARTPKGNDRDQIRAVVAGEGDLAIVNTYYLGLLAHADDPADREIAAAVGIHFPIIEGGGTHVNISGAGVAAHAPNRANAIALLEFLLRDESQLQFGAANYEYPVTDVTNSEFLQSWGKLNADEIPLSRLGELNNAAAKLFDRIGWR